MGSLRLEQGLFSRGMPISRETILRVGSRMSWVGDPAEEQISHSEEDHGFGDVEALLVIADQAAISCQPTDTAFNDPPAGNDLESWVGIGPAPPHGNVTKPTDKTDIQSS
jgi:hypothetical protein